MSTKYLVCTSKGKLWWVTKLTQPVVILVSNFRQLANTFILLNMMLHYTFYTSKNWIKSIKLKIDILGNWLVKALICHIIVIILLNNLLKCSYFHHSLLNIFEVFSWLFAYLACFSSMYLPTSSTYYLLHNGIIRKWIPHACRMSDVFNIKE